MCDKRRFWNFFTTTFDFLGVAMPPKKRRSRSVPRGSRPKRVAGQPPSAVTPSVNSANSGEVDNLRETIVQVMAETLPTLLAAQGPLLPTGVSSDSSSSVTQSASVTVGPAAPSPSGVVGPTQLPTSTVSKALQNKILTGEFVEFSELLPEVLGSSSGPQTGFQVQLLDGTPLRFMDDSTPKAKTRRHICDLATWLEAWTVYVNVVVQSYPQRTHELLGYQAIIVEANRKFLPDAWLEYDRQFRSAAANDTARKWNVVEPNAWQLATSGRARPVCSKCSLTHPPSTSGNCPFRANRAEANSSNTSINAPSVGGRPICRNFNWQRCQGMCGRAHVCISCRGRHPHAECPYSKDNRVGKPGGFTTPKQSTGKQPAK